MYLASLIRSAAAIAAAGVKLAARRHGELVSGQQTSVVLRTPVDIA